MRNISVCSDAFRVLSFGLGSLDWDEKLSREQKDAVSDPD